MTGLIKRETDGKLDCLEQSMQNIRATLRSEYWSLHKAIAENGYDCQKDQTADAIALGKLAEAQALVFEAAGCLQAIKRITP